jgi:hypothetical protein
MTDYSKCWRCEAIADVGNDRYQCTNKNCASYLPGPLWESIHDRIAAERERCAKVCDSIAELCDDSGPTEVAYTCAARIRED